MGGDGSRARISRPTLSDLLKVAEARPTEVGPLVMLADALRARGEVTTALPLYERAARLAPTDEGIWLRWSGVHFASGDFSRAAVVLREALARLPMSAALTRNLAEVCLTQGRTEEATGLFALAARSSPDESSLTGLCECCLSDRGWHSALTAATRWLQWPDSERMLPCTARALLAAGRLEEAEACFREILRSGPREAAALSGLGDIAAAGRQSEIALRFHLEALALEPDSAVSALACLFDYLAMERFAEAQSFFAERRESIRIRWGHGPQYVGLAPEWDGHAPLAGRTILVHGAAGFGDTIQYSRFLSLLQERRTRVVFEVPVPLRRLMNDLAGADQVVSKFDLLPAIDFECDARELLLLCPVQHWQLARWTPYLFPGKAERHRWRFREDLASSRFRVGIVWAAGGLFSHGRLRNRSMPLPEVQALARLLESQATSRDPGMYSANQEPARLSLISLQVGPARDGLLSAAPGLCLSDPMGKVTDFLDTAAIVSHLDAVVTVDTSVAHVAAAMGKRTLVLLPYCARWRWGTRENSSTWYPTARLCRQMQPGRWRSAVTAAGEALREMTDVVVSIDRSPAVAAASAQHQCEGLPACVGTAS